MTAALRRIASAALAGTLACTAPARPSQPGAGLPAELGDDAGQRFPERVVVDRYGRGAVATGGPALPGRHLARSPAEYVVVATRPLPRILAEAPGVRFLLYVAIEDLRRVPTREVTLSPGPDAGPRTPDAAIALLPGAEIRVRGHQARWTEVALDDPSLEADGWVPDAALGVAYRPSRVAAPPPSAGVRAGASLLDGPHGAPLARVRRSLRVAAGAAHDGFVAVDFLRSAAGRPSVIAVHARGFVAEAELAADLDEEGEVSGTTFEVADGPHRVSVPAGVPLLAAIDGEPVGITLADARANENARRGAWIELVFDTPWGDLSLWAKR